VESVLFYLLSAIILGTALLMVTSRNMVHSVVWMVASFVGIGALYILLHAEFVAAVQILVYAGGIVVLFLFVVMLVNLGEIRQMEYLHRQWVPASILALLLAAEIGFLVWGGGASLPTDVGQAETMLRGLGGNTETIGIVLYREYFFPFEIASVLLLVAMIGAIFLAKKRV
jgi:NADH-quinone oxidoreductase subunit J